MRILLSAVPAYGHILPLAPLARAALAADHDVAILTSPGAAAIVELGLGDVELLGAGAMPNAFSADAARRTGMDVMAPTPETIGEIFGGSRVDMGLADSFELAEQWQPDLVFAETFDAIGPLVASALSIGWAQVGVGPAPPAQITDAIAEVARTQYTARPIEPREAIAYLDGCPPSLQTPGFASPVAHRPMRVEPDTDGGLAQPDFADPGRPTVLLSLGTTFSTTELLNAAVGAIAPSPVNVIATLGFSIDLAGPDRVPSTDDLLQARNVAYVPFAPFGDLLADADLVLGVGGAGTVMGALAYGLPMVLWPQGADQPLTAARVAEMGAGVTVDGVGDLADAISAALEDPIHRLAAERAAAQNAAMPTAAEVVRELAA